MKLSYTDYKNRFLENIGHRGSTDPAILEAFHTYLNQRYQLVLAKLDGYITEGTLTTPSVANQQYYSLPPSIVRPNTLTYKHDSLYYPLTKVESTEEWNQLNAIEDFAVLAPSRYFVRRDDFGVWPIPSESSDTITLTYHLRDMVLSQEDYTTGTVTMTLGSTTVTGTGTSFTNAMAGRWIRASADEQWYRISSVSDSTNLVLDIPFQGVTASGLDYRIGEIPELPDEAHTILLDGVTADWHSGWGQNVTEGTRWDNKFWTGSWTNPYRNRKNVYAGLLGLINSYEDRDTSSLVNRRKGYRDYETDRLWNTVITE